MWRCVVWKQSADVSEERTDLIFTIDSYSSKQKAGTRAATCSLVVFSDVEHVASTFLCNVGKILPEYTVSYSRWQYYL
jgi:hypothetical protein